MLYHEKKKKKWERMIRAVFFNWIVARFFSRLVKDIVLAFLNFHIYHRVENGKLIRVYSLLWR